MGGLDVECMTNKPTPDDSCFDVNDQYASRPTYHRSSKARYDSLKLTPFLL